MTRYTCIVLGCLVGGACSPSVPLDGNGYQANDAAAPPDDVAPGDDAASHAPVAEANAPTVTITSPAANATLPAAAFRVEGTSGDDSSVASVFVAVGANAPQLAATTDGFKTWHLDATAPLGSFTVRATAYDLFANQGTASISLARDVSGADTSPPDIVVTEPASGSSAGSLSVMARGTATDDVGVTVVRVTLNGAPLAGQVVATDDFYATWATQIVLAPGVMNTIRFEACDAAGNCDVTTLQVQGQAEIDHDAPTIAIASPTAGTTVDTASLDVSGSANDNLGVREVKVRVGQGTAWSDYVSAARTPQPDGSVRWTATTPLVPGALTIQARAIDVSGLASTDEVAITNTYAAPYSDDQVIPLRVYTVTTPPQLRANLDKAGVNAIIDTPTQKTTLLLAVDPTSLLTNALTAIRDACNYETSSASCTAGTSKTPDWKKDLKTPDYNCGCTALGQSFTGGENSPEFRLVRLLTMTPANVEVTGTSVEKLAGVANSLGLGGGFNDIVSDMLGIAKTSEVLSIADVRSSVMTKFMATHPYLNPATDTFLTAGQAGFIPVTLYDAMNDLAPLGGALGPITGGHPGVLDPSFTPTGSVLTSAFNMLLVADSNLRWFDGVDLGPGKDYLALVVDTNGGNDVLEFNFTDPTKFDITGIAANPTVSLRLRIKENAAKVPACTSGDNSNCAQNTPSQPIGTTYVWSKPKWELEHIVTAAALGRYASRTFSKCYLSIIVCLANVDISNQNVGRDGIAGGYTDVDTALNYGTPPDNQYLWELLSEIAQVALHRVGNTLNAIPEGSANPAFTLKDIPLGLTAQQIKDKIRPTLDAQKAALSQALLGDYKQNNGNVDFYLKKGADGALYLFFTNAADPTPVAYSNAKPGFFADDALTVKTSTTAAGTSGDATHEKLKLQATGAADVTVYAQDPAGQVYRIKIHVPPTAGADIELRVARKM